MSIPDCFRLKNCIYLISKHTEKQLLSLLILSTFQLTMSVDNLRKIAWDLWKLENFEIFVIFGVNLRHFHSEHCNHLFIKTTGQPTFSLLTLWSIPKHEVCGNFKKCLQTLKWKNFGIFVFFCVNLWHFHLETCKKLRKRQLDNQHFPRGPLKAFQFFELCRNDNKKCIKTLKWKNFAIFVIFCVNLWHFHLETCKKLRKRQLDNQHFPRWPLRAFQSSKSVETITKNAWKLWKLKNFGFLSFSVWTWDFFI